MKESCRKYEEMIQHDLEASLADQEKKALKRHLDGCGSCRSELTGYSILFSGLRHMPLEEPSADFNAAILGKIRFPLRRAAPAGQRLAALKSWFVLASVLTPLSALGLYWIIAGSGRISYALSNGFLKAVEVMEWLGVGSVKGLVDFVRLATDLPILSSLLQVGRILLNATATTASDPACVFVFSIMMIIGLLSSFAMARMVKPIWSRISSNGAGAAHFPHF